MAAIRAHSCCKVADFLNEHRPAVEVTRSTVEVRIVVMAGVFAYRPPSCKCTECNLTWILEANDVACVPSTPVSGIWWFDKTVLEHVHALHVEAHLPMHRVVRYVNSVGARLAAEQAYVVPSAALQHAFNEYVAIVRQARDPVLLRVSCAHGPWAPCLSCADIRSSWGDKPIEDLNKYPTVAFDGYYKNKALSGAAPCANVVFQKALGLGKKPLELAGVKSAFFGKVNDTRAARAAASPRPGAGADGDGVGLLKSFGGLCTQQHNNIGAACHDIKIVGRAQVLIGAACPHDIPVCDTFVDDRVNESHGVYRELGQQLIAYLAGRQLRFFLDFACLLARPAEWTNTGAVVMLVDWLHAKTHVPSCRYLNGAMHVPGTGAGVGVQAERLWSDLVQSANMVKYMAPTNRIRYMDLMLQNIVVVKERKHFPNLVKSIRHNRRRLDMLKKTIIPGIIQKALEQMIGLASAASGAGAAAVDADPLAGEGSRPRNAPATEDDVRALMDDLARELTAKQTGPSALATSGLVPDSLSEFVNVAFMHACLEAHEHVAVLLGDVKVSVLKAQQQILEARLIVLFPTLTPQLGMHGYSEIRDSSSEFHALGALPPADIRAAIEHHLHEARCAIEQIVGKIDQIAILLNTPGRNDTAFLKGDTLRYRKRLAGLKADLRQPLLQYAWWSRVRLTREKGLEFDPALPTPAEVDVMKDDCSARAGRKFPWGDVDDMLGEAVQGGAARRPTLSVVAEYRDAVAERDRRTEELTTFLPDSLRRAQLLVKVSLEAVKKAMVEDRARMDEIQERRTSLCETTPAPPAIGIALPPDESDARLARHAEAVRLATELEALCGSGCVLQRRLDDLEKYKKDGIAAQVVWDSAEIAGPEVLEVPADVSEDAAAATFLLIEADMLGDPPIDDDGDDDDDDDDSDA